MGAHHKKPHADADATAPGPGVRGEEVVDVLRLHDAQARARRAPEGVLLERRGVVRAHAAAAALARGGEVSLPLLREARPESFH